MSEAAIIAELLREEREARLRAELELDRARHELEQLTRLEGRVTALEHAREDVERDHAGLLERVGVLERANWKAIGAGGIVGVLVASAPKLVGMLSG